MSALALSVALSGCSLLHKKKSGDTTYAEQPVDQLYSVGADKLDHRRWSEGVTYMKEVERQHPYSEWSRRAILMEAYAHYESNDYTDAVADADRFIDLYPGNGSAAYAYFLKAQCYFEQILDVGRDQDATQQAQTAMREVVRRFPKTEYAEDARLKLDMISDQLAGKEMTIGRWYLRQGDTLAAVGRFKTVVDKYQTTSHTPEALERLVEAYLTLGLIEEAKRNAAVLGYNYPGDIWYEDAYKLMVSKGYPPSVKPARGKHHGLLERTSSVTSGNAAADAAPPPPGDQPAAPAKKKKHGLFGWGHHDKSQPAPAADDQAPPAAQPTP
ncbi:MAG TPA: outer membrane protein assembly factor BamD [Caulobacteraceae bacterium]|nr:outer membrane protein assembly factor BamD [Caulobacteraceae bacterium]